MNRKRFIILFGVFCMVFTPTVSYAYIDPATTTYLIQIVSALIITLGATIGIFFSRIRMFLSDIRVKWTVFRVNFFSKKKDGVREVKSSRPASPRRRAAEPVSNAQFVWADKRLYKNRIKFAFFPVLGLIFTVLFFGPFELYYSNQEFFPFPFSSLLITIGVASLFSILVMCLLLSLLKGKVFNVVISLVFSTLFACYIQGNFLNLDLGNLDGTAIEWSDYAEHGIINAFVWILVFIIPIIIGCFRDSLWKKMVVFIPMILICVQIVAMVSLISTTDIESKSTHVIVTDEQFTLSEKENIVVIILDGYAGDTIDTLQDENPNLLDGFKDFTFFRNYNCSVVGTFSGGATTYTGHEYDGTIPYRQYFRDAWGSPQVEEFYKGLEANSFVRNFYISLNYIVGDSENAKGIIDNIDVVPHSANYFKILKNITKLSLYRYAPHVAKPSFWMHSGMLTNTYTPSRDKGDFNVYTDYETDKNHVFLDTLRKDGITLRDDASSFTLYHILGDHPPYDTDEYGQYDPNSDQITSAKGALFVVEQYLEEMKSLGIYDDATIIISSDHSDYIVPRPSTLLLVKRSNETHDETVVNQAPVSQIDFIPTLMQLSGMDHTPYGRSFYEIDENEQRDRTTRIWANVPELPQTTPAGRFNAFRELKFNGHVDDVDLEDSTVYPIYDSLY